jgi:hypothetical protein
MGPAATTSTASTTPSKPARARLSRAALPLRLLLLLPAIVLFLSAVPRLLSGRAVDAAFPVPVYMATDIPLPRAAYVAAENALAKASPGEGEALISRAQAATLAGEPPNKIMPILQAGLAKAPASAAGWTLLAELQASNDAWQGASALQLALDFAPYDFWLGGRRAALGAALWPSLSDPMRARVLRQARLLWTEEQLRPQLLRVLTTPAGAALLKRAFAATPDTLREINRWVTREKLRGARATPEGR